MNMTTKRDLVCYVVGCIAGGIAVAAYDFIPRENTVQQESIAPSRLEIQCEDLDDNGLPETVLRIDDKSYLIREIDGKPVLTPYTIKPKEIVPEGDVR